MTRQQRLDAPSTLHHIMGRSIKRVKLFSTGKDREDFLEHLGLWDQKVKPQPKANDLPINIQQIVCSARPGATRLPVAAQRLHHSKCDFLRLQWW